MKEIFSDIQEKELLEIIFGILDNVLILTDILHDGQGTSRLLFSSFVENQWLDKDVFEKKCLLLAYRNSSSFQGKNFRKLLMYFFLIFFNNFYNFL